MYQSSLVKYRFISLALLFLLSQGLHSEPFYWRVVLDGSGDVVESANPSGLCDTWVGSLNDGISGNSAGNYFERSGFAHATPSTDVRSLSCNAELFAGPGSDFPEGHLIVGQGRSVSIQRRGNGCPDNAPLINGECAVADVGTCDGQSMRGNPINVGSGNKYQREVDYSGPGGLRFVRHYNSRALSSAQEFAQVIGDDRVGDRLVESGWIGERWRHSYQRVLLKSLPRVGLDYEPGTFRPLTACQSCHSVGFPANDSIKLEAHLLRPDGRLWLFRHEPDGQWISDEGHQGVLTEHADGNGQTTGWTFINAQHEREFYDAQGRLLSLERRGGQRVSLSYDPASGRLSQINDAHGHTLSLAYDSADRLATLTDPDGGVIEYHYDSLNNLTGVTYADLSQKHYQYAHPQLPHALTAIFDENQGLSDPVPLARFDYEVFYGSSQGNQGRAVLSMRGDDAGRVTVDYAHSTVTELVDAARGVESVTEYGFARRRASFLPASLSGDVCEGCGQAATTTYDESGFIDLQTDANGHQTDYDHDARGLEVLRTEAVGTADERNIHTDWHPVFRLPTRVESALMITLMTYSDQGDMLSRTLMDKTGVCANDDMLPGCRRVTRFSYYPEGHQHEYRLQSVDGPRTDANDITTYEYDSQGRVAQLSNALGHITRFHQYDPHGNPTEIEDANGVITQLEYDARQRLVRQTVALNTSAEATTTLSYYPNGTLLRVTGPDGAYLQFDYDIAQRLISVEDNLGNRMDYTLDNAGHRKAETHRDPLGVITQTQTALYNQLSELDTLLGAGQQRTVYQYDAGRNLTQITDPKAQITTQQYDALNRLTHILDPENGASNPTRFDYDVHDNLTQVTDPRGLVTEYRYNGFDEPIEQISPNTNTTTFAYDEAGNLIRRRDARGVTVLFNYDALNRLTHIDYPGTVEDVFYTYDQTTAFNGAGHPGRGRLTRIDDHSGRTEFRYDDRGNIIEQSLTLHTDLAGSDITVMVGYAYDAADNLTQIIYPSGRTVDMTRNAIGQVIEVATTQQGQTQVLAEAMLYQPFGPINSATLGNGLTLGYHYDMDGRLTQQRTDTLFERDYQFDLNSNIELISNLLDASQNQLYRYDALNRTTEANRTDHDIQYDYDPVGNRLDKTINGASEVYQYGVENHRLSQITGAQTINYQYDTAGNTVQKNNDLFNYHLANRLATATVQGQITHYLYNAQGQRTLKTHANNTTLFIYDLQGQLIAELNDQGQTEKETVYLNGQPLAQIEAANEPQNPLIFTATRTQWTGVGEDLGQTVELILDTQQPSLQAHFLNGQSRHYAFSEYQDHTLLGRRYIEAAQYTPEGIWSFFEADMRVTDTQLRFESYDAHAAAMGGAYWGVTYTLNTSPPADHIFYYHNDHLGTPQKLTDHNQQVVWEAAYTPFGQATVNEDPDGDGNYITQNIRFPGQYFDQETGFYYNWYRYYDPSTGRYITSDPIGLAGGMNTYTYVSNNPINLIDPYGLAETGAAIGGTIGGTIGAIGGGIIGGSGGAAGGTVFAPGVGTVGGGIAGGIEGALIGGTSGALAGAIIGSTIEDLTNAAINAIRNLCEEEDDNCEALYQSILQTCAGLTGRKKFKCFEAARIARDQCYQERN